MFCFVFKSLLFIKLNRYHYLLKFILLERLDVTMVT